MTELNNINIPREKIISFCKRNHIQKLSFFGSVTRDDFTDGSDIDVLVEFEARMGPGFIGIARMERELTEMLGRKVDLRTPNELGKHFREEVISSAVVQYVKG